MRQLCIKLVNFAVTELSPNCYRCPRWGCGNMRAVIDILSRVFLQEDINFLLTNRIPRRYATLFISWWSRIENGWVRDLSLSLFQRFAGDLGLHEAKKQSFRSLHDCFIRELRPGARRIDPDPAVLISPCDAIVGAHGRIRGDELFQIKGFPYTLSELLADEALARRYRDGLFITLRLKASMYHRFHAPCDCALSEVHYISGETWNVNPIAIKRIERLFCKNERVVLPLSLADSKDALALVAVASILVASLRLHFLKHPLDLRYKGKNRLLVGAVFQKGQELGYFELGSTILVLAAGDFRLCDHLAEGTPIRVGQPLFERRIGCPNSLPPTP